MPKSDSHSYLLQFDPYRDSADWVSESPEDYAARMQATLLPNWPTEVLVEWLHRHAGNLYAYAFLGFENLRFERQTWPLARIPGRDAFADPGYCDAFQNLETRAANPHDWLANHMLSRGTWNTPIILLLTGNEAIRAPGGWYLNPPLHLLEGHRRLSFLVALRALGKARPDHDVWIATLIGGSTTR